MFYYTYVLKSEKDSDLYIGWANNLISRIKNYNLGKVESTKYRTPLKLIYYEIVTQPNDQIVEEPSTGISQHS